MLEEPDGNKPADAVIWLQKAFALADPLEENVALGIAELKVSVQAANLSSGPLTSGVS